MYRSYFSFVEIRLEILFLLCIFIVCVNFVFTASTYSKCVLLSHKSGEYLGVVAMEFDFWPETALRTKGCEPAPCLGPTTFSPQFWPLSINRFSKCCRDLQIIILIDIAVSAFCSVVDLFARYRWFLKYCGQCLRRMDYRHVFRLQLHYDPHKITKSPNTSLTQLSTAYFPSFAQNFKLISAPKYLCAA